MSKCPTCKKPSQKDFAPFCSERCKQVDLGKWFAGSYAVATNEAPEVNDNHPQNQEEY